MNGLSNVEAENNVIGSVFLDNKVINEVFSNLEEEDFTNFSNQLIFSSFVELDKKSEPIDATTVVEMIRKQHPDSEFSNILNKVLQLSSSVPTTANVSRYIKIVKDYSKRRAIVKMAEKIKQDANSVDDIDDLLDSANNEVAKIAVDSSDKGYVDENYFFDNFRNDLLSLNNPNTQVSGLSTGYDNLDSLIGGLKPGELTVLAARPAMGKSAFALNVIQNVIDKYKKDVLLFSLEMSSESIFKRQIALKDNILLNHLNNNQLFSEDIEKLYFHIKNGNDNLKIDDYSANNMSSIKAISSRLASKGNLGLIVIDYLQLIETSHSENRQVAVAEISRNLKRLSKDLNVPVIALSQLSRGVEQRQDKRPMLSDIRESGAIEQDADIVAFLYRDNYYQREEEDEDDFGNDVYNYDEESNIAEVIVAKNRSGKTGTAMLNFVEEYGKFNNSDNNVNF